MTSKEMKLVKFEKLIGDIWKKMPSFYPGKESPLQILFGNEWSDEYSVIVVNNALIANIQRRDAYSGYTDAKSLVEKSSACTHSEKWAGYNLGAQTVFFGLMALAIDVDSYNEKLSILTDYAYLVGFDEDMIGDWVYAVKTVLSAEKINTEKMKSANAKQFFKGLA